MSAFDVEKIEARLDRAVISGTQVSMALGGVQIKDMGELLEIARLMSMSGVAVPYHLRGNPGSCLAVAMRALRSGFDPFMLAEHSYIMAKNQKTDDGRWEKVETLAFDSFVIRAIIEAHANLTGPLRYTFDGEGDEMTCTVTATPRGEKEPLIHTSEKLGHMKAARGRNDKGDIKGSPLWDTNPRQQLGYATGRDFCRRYFPQVLMGYYDRDEMDENVPPERTIEPVKTSGLRARLQKPKDAQPGFDHAAINKTIDGEVAKRDAPSPSVSEASPPAQPETERAAPDDKGVPAPESGAAVVSEASPAVSQPAQSAATAEPGGGGDPPTAPPPGQEAQLPANAGMTRTGATIPVESTSVPRTRGDESSGADGPKLPALPKDGADYPNWVDGNLPDFENPNEVDIWWKSEYERKLRNSLPNLTQEIVDEAKVKVADRKKQLRKEV